MLLFRIRLVAQIPDKTIFILSVLSVLISNKRIVHSLFDPEAEIFGLSALQLTQISIKRVIFKALCYLKIINGQEKRIPKENSKARQ